ncbi:hypothetical protein ACFP3U_00050 [Kitasatospora misakiensis]|uniref:Diacylglycerol O-acyltransferase n=1 Tax=Kitasatospora misakiensis TaxID=67330 RepID=A0ABW0WWT6_9ACTN
MVAHVWCPPSVCDGAVRVRHSEARSPARLDQKGLAAMTPASMHPFDHAFLTTMHSYSGARWDCVAVFHLNGPAPALEDLRAQVDAGTRAMPFLTQRLPLPGTGGARRSETGLTARVEQIVVGSASEMGSALEDALDASPLPDGVPWRLWSVSSPGGDHWIAGYQWHHGYQDGLAGVRAALSLLGLRDPGRPGRPSRRIPWHTYAVAALTFAGKCAADQVRARWYGPAARVRLAGEAGPVRSVRVPLERLKAIAVAAGGTVNDVYVAATGSALAAWAAQEGVRLVQLPLLVPVDVRRHDEEQAHGNRLFFLRMALPCGTDVTVAQRLAVVTETSNRAKRLHWRRIAQDFVGAVPRRLACRLVPMFTAPGFTAAVVSSVVCPGPEDTVTRFTGRGALVPGHLMFAVMGVLGDQVEVGFQLDRALPGAGRFPELWSAAVEELERSLLTGIPAPPRAADSGPQVSSAAGQQAGQQAGQRAG